MSDVVGPVILDERFEQPALDRSLWFPFYLPHWCSRSNSAAAYHIDGEGLNLHIPEGHPLWCPDLHDEPLRVSCVQTGAYSGPIDSTVGQMAFRDGLRVVEEQEAFRGFTPTYVDIEVRMRALVSARSMFAF